jgi:TonB family protein
MRFLITLLLWSLLINAYAQRQNVYYFKDDGRPAYRDSADFIRVVREPDSGSVFFKLMEYYPNGKPKRLSLTSTISPLTLEGSCVSYYKNGQKKEILNYKKGAFRNEQYYYYPNGKLAEVRNYPDSLNRDAPIFGPRYLITTFNDTTGTELVVNGNGVYKTQNSITKTDVEGKIKNGYKEGNWKITINKDSIHLNELYKQGRLITGTANFKNGDSTNYNEREKLPQFIGGTSAFNNFLARHLRYPSEAYNYRIQGRVNVTFVVERDGSLSDIKIVGPSPDQSLGAEAIRVVKQSPKWLPGMQYGRAVRVKYTVPIVFNLGK